ncbi:hypothetical protein [Nocardia xishanensis]|uniref:Enoyl-CoA hydratase n=2 Tax=Nocardia xishanensis TaxID=238964 RepID=A0ABW7X119_9NOCA
MDELVLCSIDGAIATLTLNRPGKLNALTADVFDRLRARRLSAAEAADIGLVDHCAPDAELDGYVAELTARIAANSPGSNRI